MNFFSTKNITQIVGDLIVVALSAYGGLYLRFFSLSSYQERPLDPFLPKAIMFSFFIVFICFFMDLYSSEKPVSRKEIFVKILFAGIFASVALASFYYFVPSLQIGRGILFFAICISILAQSVWHIGFNLLLNLPIVAGRVLILGTGPVAKNMGTIINSNSNNFALVGYVNCVGEPASVPASDVIGSGDSLLGVALRERVHKIVVSLSERRGTFPVREVLDCKLKGIEVVDGPSFYEELTGKLLIESINPSYLIFSEGFRITMLGLYMKRMFDVVFAVSGLIFALPLWIVISIIIKATSKGPVLFKQTRMGEGEKDFTLYKFRTMVQDAEKSTGPVWSRTGDNRITKTGRFLRKIRLDEIPQLLNVIKGEMSFIGPRPERPFFVDSLSKQIPYYSERHCVKPGITGWAQVRYEYGDSIEDAIEKLRYDLYYIKYQSIALDFLIVLDTIKVILFGRGGR